MSVHTFSKSQVGRKYHVQYPTLKHVENSLRGSRYAVRHGYRTTDLDMLPDAVLYRASAHATIPRSAIVGHIRNDHWPDPFRHDGFRDPKHILGRGDHMHEMEPFEIDRLRAGHRPRLYRIPTIEQQFALCPTLTRNHRYGLQMLLEPKPGASERVWLHPEVWDYLAELAEQHRARVAVYSLFHECLPYARHAGFNAWPISHG